MTTHTDLQGARPLGPGAAASARTARAHRPRAAIGAQRLLATTAAAAALAAAANSALRLAAVSLFDIPAAFEPLEAGAATVASVVAAAGAGITLGLLTRLAADPIARFRQVAVAVLVLSFGAIVPLALANPPEHPGTGVLSIATLSAMHVLTALVVVATLTRLPPRRG